MPDQFHSFSLVEQAAKIIQLQNDLCTMQNHDEKAFTREKINVIAMYIQQHARSVMPIIN